MILFFGKKMDFSCVSYENENAQKGDFVFLALETKNFSPSLSADDQAKPDIS